MATEMNVPGYEELASILQGAYDQAARGKGAERHASTKMQNSLPWTEQPIMGINLQLGSVDGALYQVIKKATEVQNLDSVERKVRELYGSIVYAAAAIHLLQTTGERDVRAPIRFVIGTTGYTTYESLDKAHARDQDREYVITEALYEDLLRRQRAGEFDGVGFREHGEGYVEF